MANYALIQDPETPNLTASTSKNVIINGSHNFKIQGFSTTKGMGVGKYISSDTFVVGGHCWKVYFYPDGNRKVDESSQVDVSCYIGLVNNDSKNVRYFFELALLDQHTNKWYSTSSYFKRMHEAGTYSIPSILAEDRKLMWGYLTFYKRTELEASQFVKDDCLTIQCTVGVVKTSMGSSKTFAQLPDLGEFYGQLLDSKEGSDVSFTVEGKIFYAHKLILSTRSPVFKAQFFGLLKEKKTRCIKIEEMHAPVFKVLLHFIYCDAIPDVGEVPAGLDAKWVVTTMTQHLLAAADRYGIERLKSLCELRLCENIAIDTVAASLALAEQHGCFQLKSTCLEFIGLPENLEAVIQTDGFKNLKENCPDVMDVLFKSVARLRDYLFVSNGPGIHERESFSYNRGVANIFCSGKRLPDCFLGDKRRSQWKACEVKKLGLVKRFRQYLFARA